jgi:hypothetical protein
LSFYLHISHLCAIRAKSFIAVKVLFLT